MVDISFFFYFCVISFFINYLKKISLINVGNLAYTYFYMYIKSK